MKLRAFIKLAFKDEEPKIDNRLLGRDVMQIAIDKLIPVAILYDLSLGDLICEIIAQRCRVCGCTQYDCSQCIEKTGGPCRWVKEDLCSACVPTKKRSTKKRK